jgi:hypothetical protein
VAGYLIADNYKQLGESQQVKKTWLIAIASTLIIFVIAWYLPENFPQFIVPIRYSVGVYYLVQRIQGTKIKAHMAAGGETWSIGRAVLAGIVGFAIIFVIIVAAFLLTDRSFTR